ncbi:MAG: peroxide stress protein YaaA [Rubrivivax sp.]
MLFLLSPAKTLDYETPVRAPVLRLATDPLNVDRAAELIATLRRKSAAQVAQLMDLSPKLAQLNVDRYAAWQPEATAANSRPALLAFAGDVYTGLDAGSLSTTDLRWAQDHLVLLSGLYGALRPLDRLQPYRLEMGTALKTRHGKNLYDYWGDRVAQGLDERLANEKTPRIINLASIEYAKVALRPALKAQVLDCVFEDWKDGRYKVIGFFAKRARGAMARHAIRSRARSPKALQGFDSDGYRYDAAASEPTRLVFRRRGSI